MQSELKFPTLSTQTAAGNKKTTLVNKVSNLASLLTNKTISFVSELSLCSLKSLNVHFQHAMIAMFGILRTDQRLANLATPCVSTWCYITSTCVTRFLSHTHKQTHTFANGVTISDCLNTHTESNRILEIRWIHEQKMTVCLLGSFLPGHSDKCREYSGLSDVYCR